MVLVFMFRARLGVLQAGAAGAFALVITPFLGAFARSSGYQVHWLSFSPAQCFAIDYARGNRSAPGICLTLAQAMD